MRILQTQDIAARLVPLSRVAREALLARIPQDRGYVSQLADAFGGTWYLHAGDLTLDGDWDSTLNLVVDGDLTVRGTLNDDGAQALLLVTGDLRCEHLFTRRLLVVLGSLWARGLVYADGNDYSFEVWGQDLQAQALILYDREILLPEGRRVGLEYDTELFEPVGDLTQTFNPDLLVGPDGEASAEPTAPADFDTFLAALRAGWTLFRPRAPGGVQDWRLDREAPPQQVAAYARDPDQRLRRAAVAHPRIGGALADRLAADADPSVRAAAAQCAALSAESVATLVQDPDPAVRRQLAAGPHAQPYLAILVADPDPMVRRALASHPGLDDAQRRALISDPERAVKARALHYLPLTAAWVAELGAGDDELHRAWALERAARVESAPASRSGWRAGLLDPSRKVREATLASVRGDLAVLPFLAERADRFVQDESPRLRQALAMAARDPATLAALAEDPDPEAQRMALKNAAMPPDRLVAAAERLANAPARVRGPQGPGYDDWVSQLHFLLTIPSLPAAALRLIEAAYPRGWRMDPHPQLPLDLLLQRARWVDEDLGEDAAFGALWEQALGGADPGPLLAALLDLDSNYLREAVRTNAATPIAALERHALALGDDSYRLAHLARNPQLGSGDPAAQGLLQRLLDLDEGEVNQALSGNPALPAAALARLCGRGQFDAVAALWQLHGQLPSG
jgi:hypothetical protein